MTLDDIAVDLYGLAPSEFVTARTARVKAARDAGDKELAAAIGKLRKPTVTAWTVNLLAREAPDDVAALLQLGAALRTAQQRLSGAELRSLTGQRQQAVTALAKKAGALAAEHGHPVNESVLREIGQTLTAALADPAVAEHVHTGTLATATTYSGFGPAGPGLVAVETPAATADTEPADNPREELDEALEALESARAARDTARDEAEQATSRLGDIEARIAELKDELDRAEQERQFTRSTERTAQDQLRSAQRQLDRMERWVERARDRVDGE
ncbi:hypothetical protein [Nocardia sp. NPDC049149]|uniref:hypothetical protein n=1 Tax=Nocardia sp. NPDC049149 TaxID=3364315 RepID=UPI00372070D6